MTEPKFKFSKRSLEKLYGVNPKLITCAHEAIKITSVDFGITCGLRTAEEQNILYQNGKSKLDGYYKKSRHQSGDAIDILPYLDGKAQ